MPRIALVEDDASIAELVRYNLAEEGHDVAVHRDGESFLQALAADARRAPDLLVLDVMLPGVDGFAVLSLLRAMPAGARTPVLMLTARGSEADKVRGLEAGADDYLAKPFGVNELKARVLALLRRAGMTPPSEAGAPIAAPSNRSAEASRGELRGAGGVVLDDARHRVFRNGAEVSFTHREYELLRHLLANVGIAFSRDDLLREVWGYDFAGETRTVDVHVRQLRSKLGDADPDAPLIETVRGRGYRYREDGAPRAG